MDIKSLAREAFDKDKHTYHDLAKTRAIKETQRLLNWLNFTFCNPEEVNRILELYDSIKEYEVGKIYDRLEHRMIIMALYPDDMKEEYLEKNPV